MKLKQSLVAKTTLSEKILIAEGGYNAVAKPGNYNVYHVWFGDFRTLLFVHKNEPQNINDILGQLDIQDHYAIDWGTYGIINQDMEGVTWSDYFFNWSDYHDNQIKQQEGGYVQDTYNGDGSFICFTNVDNSVFLLDNTGSYIKYILPNYNIKLEQLAKVTDYRHEDNTITVNYDKPLKNGHVAYLSKTETIKPDERVIDALMKLVKSL